MTGTQLGEDEHPGSPPSKTGILLLSFALTLPLPLAPPHKLRFALYRKPPTPCMG